MHIFSQSTKILAKSLKPNLQRYLLDLFHIVITKYHLNNRESYTSFEKQNSVKSEKLARKKRANGKPFRLKALWPPFLLFALILEESITYKAQRELCKSCITNQAEKFFEKFLSSVISSPLEEKQ